MSSEDSLLLQWMVMSRRLTIRITDELLRWLKRRSRRTGIAMSHLVRDGLESARANEGKQRFLDLAGLLKGPPDLSSRKGFSRK